MNTRKSELRKIVIDIVFGRESTKYEPSQFMHLALGVAEVLEHRQTKSSGYSASVFSYDKKLDEADWLLVNEIFWDLVTERVLTVGMDSANPDYPWFRRHSEAETNLRKEG